jgi:hypothetical protein
MTNFFIDFVTPTRKKSGTLPKTEKNLCLVLVKNFKYYV